MLAGRGVLPSEIICEALYLGNSHHGSRPGAILQCGITHVVNITQKSWKKELEAAGVNVEILHCDIPDHPGQDIAQFFHAVRDFIDQGLAKGGRVLIHCEEGVSRSPTLVMSYLMLSKVFDLQKAIIYIRRRRPMVNPNNGFMRQLIELERQLYGKVSVDASLFTDDYGSGCLFVSPPSGFDLRLALTIHSHLPSLVVQKRTEEAQSDEHPRSESPLKSPYDSIV